MVRKSASINYREASLLSSLVILLGNLESQKGFAIFFQTFQLRRYLSTLFNSPVHCSVVKHAESGRARKTFRGKHETQSSVFPHFLSALPLPNPNLAFKLHPTTINLVLRG